MIKNNISTLLGAKKINNITKFAEQVGISYPAAYELYHEKTSGIKWEMLEKLCQYFNCQPGDLLFYVPDAEQRQREQQ